ncbi:helix-turn-helix domain-containing protein [Burkholderia sp. Se-20373]|uniref:helix-turn-helix domain-containing protein n=1 Tax=Burkholderia sp. Se-20373 TaxID=2703898 RepID=UPI00197F18CD|nr:helix-turn-helix domain-containing protein [Burkholderia sp. Se-20373]MBN3744366.1 helix-turn-helix domain-containing protein [Burkholderia sp. Se-20373]
MSDYLLNKHRFHSFDPDEVSDFIGRIYADNQFTAQHATHREVTMTGVERNGIGIYDVDYLMPFHFRSTETRPNYLFLSCRRGQAKYEGGSSDGACIPGDVMPISSSDRSFCSTGPDGFGHLSVIIDAERVRRFIAQWIGQPATDPIKFSLQPIAPEVSAQWNIAASCLRSMMRMSPVPDLAIEGLLEHMLKIVVTGHFSNYSALFNRESCTSDAQTGEAIRMIEAFPMHWKTLGAVAHALGVPSEALEHGIRRVRGKSYAELHDDARFVQVNKALLRGGDTQRFAEILLAHGFSISVRFVRQYIRRFGEPPSSTYRRNPNAVNYPSSPTSSTFEEFNRETINQFIDQSLESKLDTSEVSRFLGMSERATVEAFKIQFARTPKQYVIERRLERARWLLENTSDSILSIAMNCGFGTQSYLATAIKHQFGATPSEIRRAAFSGRTAKNDDRVTD